MKKIVLASRSPRRKELLERSGLEICVLPSNIKEGINTTPSIKHYCIKLALSKAENVAGRISNAIVIAADTIVVYKNKLFGKPKNIRDAKRILSTLSGTKHYVYTAIAVIDTKTRKRIVDIDKTIIFTRKLSPLQIKMFSRKNHDKAGAYAIQEKSDPLVNKIEGDFYNVVGLPVKKLSRILKCFNIKMKTLKSS